MKKPIKPKPCGHCGKKPRILETQDGFRIACFAQSCPHPSTDYRSTLQQAIDEWNEECV
jgi:hypothetical protein